MIERVEIEIRQALNTHWDGMILTGGHGLLARAAIEAMREPTRAMILAGMKEQNTDLESEYRAMIDEALR